ncbi:MAG: low temperature requirement protein A [Acidimicrobiales bacterium]
MSMRLVAPMAPRDPDEAHRASTPLELFLDLTFVVAIAQASSSLHHGLVDGHAGEVLVAFPFAFFAIWWAWMNFTWFASAYDTDDAIYRLAVFVQMVGVLILAAGMPRVFAEQDYAIGVVGYVVMRLAMVGQWLRAASAHPAGRRCAHRYALGIALLQMGWVLRLALPDTAGYVAFFVLGAAELAIPLWAEASGRTTWHPRHIAERYGLFTIIVLGESVLAATLGVQAALDADSSLGDVAPVIVGGLLIVFSMWWVYFDMPGEAAVERVRVAFAERLTAPFLWGYGHYFVFAGAAATGAGLAVAVDQAVGHSALSDLEAGFTITVPVTVYLVSVWLIHRRHKPPSRLNTYAVPVIVVLILAASFTPQPALVTGLVGAALVAAHVVVTTTARADVIRQS